MKTESTRTNVVLIMSDQHNARFIQGLGSQVVRTPNLTRLANGGVVFNNAYCPSPLCCPSRMGFLTGCYPSAVDVWDNGSILSTGIATVAHALGRGGYEAVLCGRMHFGGSDQFHGFEKRLIGDCNNAITSELLGRGANRTNGQTRYAVEIAGYGKSGYQEYDRRVVDHACRFITNRSVTDRPFFLVVGMVLPHNPLICRKEFFDYYMDRVGPLPEVNPDYLGFEHPAVAEWRDRRGLGGLSSEQHRRALCAYFALVTEMDENIGRLLDCIAESSVSGTTRVVYCSDHGDQAYEHGLWWKSAHYDSSARVPMIFDGSWQFPAGTRESVVSLVDLGPTFLDLCDCPPLPGASGRTFRSILERGRARDWDDEAFCEYSGDHLSGPSCMIRRMNWKLIYYADFDSFQLFNIANDPWELHDLRDSPEHRKVALGLLDRIRSRWSAEVVRRGIAREREVNDLLHGCGHPLIPSSAIVNERYGTEHNEFDFDQVPEIAAIRERVTRGPSR